EGAPVLMSCQLDKSGQAVAFARPEEETLNMADDRQWREMTADPKFRRVLVTNGRSLIGQEAVAALKAAGAKTVFVGVSEPWRPFAGEQLLRGQAGIEIVTLDAADEKSTTDLAADIGGKVDILINTTEYVRPGGLLDRRGTGIARDEIDQAYLGFINLAQAFGPAMRMRGADGINSSAAWVNILSVYALANWPAFGAYSASQAACLSLSHCLRAELRPGGVKVMNLFTGPVDTEWFQTVPPPKVAPRAVAQAIVSGLRGGLEEIYVGDVAEEIRQRLAANPKALERELDR
ncbi:MAG: SDR family NAD(P)-dependent oxidoreductase, partial [Bradyrhizobium sp.]|uniref:SDR family NAD(P)-dependent oxidoreductase n=1 Tax=Bradyrhizobium sp. TaxID=376 RepID=UPI00391A7435